MSACLLKIFPKFGDGVVGKKDNYTAYHFLMSEAQKVAKGVISCFRQEN